MKKLIALLLALVMVFAWLPVVLQMHPQLTLLQPMLLQPMLLQMMHP